MENKKQFVELANAREDNQRKVMEQIVKDGVCPFCMENFLRYHKRPILREGTYWVFTTNQWPYEHTKHHFLAVPKQHIESLEELTGAAMSELLEHFQWATKEYSIPGGAFFMRFGDPKYTGGSVTHIHAQLIQGDCGAPGHEHVRVKLG